MSITDRFGYPREWGVEDSALRDARRMSGSDYDDDFEDEDEDEFDDSCYDDDDDDFGSDLDAYDDLPLEDDSYGKKKDDIMEELGGSLYPPTGSPGKSYSSPSMPSAPRPGGMPKPSLPSRISDDDILL